MTDKDHSPIPWRDNGFEIIDADGAHVPIYGSKMQSPKEFDNRRFIVAAVNTRADYAPLEQKHARLLAAAKQTIEQADQTTNRLKDGTPNRTEACWKSYNDLVAAIAAAEEQVT